MCDLANNVRREILDVAEEFGGQGEKSLDFAYIFLYFETVDFDFFFNFFKILFLITPGH